METLTLIIIGVVCVVLVLTLILTLSNFKSNVTPNPPVLHVNDVDVLINTVDVVVDKTFGFNIENYPTVTKTLANLPKAPAFTINWGDGTVETYTYEGDAPKDIEHIYVDDGDYTIKITGDYTGISPLYTGLNKIIINDNLNINVLSADSTFLTDIVNLDKLYSTLQYFDISNNDYLSNNLEENLLNFPKLIKLYIYNKGLTSFNTQGFENLEDLNIERNTGITSLDVTNLTKLKSLNIQQNTGITTLNVLNLVDLEILYLSSSFITDAKTLINDIPNKTKLKKLSCSGLITGTFNVTDFTNLEDLFCGRSNFNNLIINGLTKLNYLSLFNNTGITTLDVSGLTSLTSLDVVGMSSLSTLDCSNSGITSLDLTGLTSLTSLNCSDSRITTLNPSGTTNLVTLNCSSCKFIQENAESLATQLLTNGKTNGDLDLRTQTTGAQITISGSLATLASAPKNWTVSVTP